MKNLITIIVFAMTFVSCNQKESGKNSMDYADSLEISIKAKEMTDSIINNIGKNRLLDTVGMSKNPVKVLSAKFIKKEYSNYKNVKLVYKNVSSKKIIAIRFEWYGENSFNEPADMIGSISEGVGGGFTEEPLGPGKTNSGEWDILSRDGKKIIAARAFEVAFADGTKWKLNQ